MWNPTNIQNRGRILQWFKFRKFATRTTFQRLHQNQATNNQKYHQQKIEKQKCYQKLILTYQKISSMLGWFIIDSIDPFQTLLLHGFLCLRPHLGIKTLNLNQQSSIFTPITKWDEELGA